MKSSTNLRHFGFTLLETVIAIGVLAVLLTGFMVVFAPAAEGIRKSINVQQADRMASTLEQEMVTFRATDKIAGVTSGFDKAFGWIKDSTTSNTNNALLVYQYRGQISNPRPDDGTPTPVNSTTGSPGKPGKDYVVVPMARRLGDTQNLKADLEAVEGAVFLVKCTQLVFGTLPSPPGGQGLILGKEGKIENPKPNSSPSTPSYDGTAATYPEAVIAFAANFYLMPAKTYKYFDSKAFTDKYTTLKNPVFTRNLAVRR